MGIKYLTKLVNSQNLYQDEEFGAGRLVIDGSSLVYHLYFDSGLEQNRGGEYSAFKDLIQKFFKALNDCHITPYVIFDGCADFGDLKRDTEKERATQRIKEAHKAAETGKAKGILPTLIWEVFRQTLESLKVQLARTYTEADAQVAALAHEWDCPVLSNDSDFFIFPMKGGLLPTSHFRWEEVVQRDGQKKISCKRYFYSQFCTVNNVQPQLLPVFAALAGNDYVNMPLQIGASSGPNPHPSKLHDLLAWISSLNLNDPLEVLKAALKNMPKQQRGKKPLPSLEKLQELVTHYSLPQSPQSPLSVFFCEDTTPPLPQQMVPLVPDWMRNPVTKAQFSSDFLDIITLRRVGLSVVVDHKDKPSANLVSLPLRRVLYGLLLGAGPSLTVEERDRDKDQVKYTQVQPDSEVPFSIKSLEQATEEQKRQVLLDALGLDQHTLHTSLPSHLSHLALPLAVTCYWLMKATPPESLLEALLIGWCKGDELSPKAAKDPDSGQTLDLDCCHWLNQWQSCFRDSLLLNQLLGGPLPRPNIAQLYNGTLLHFLHHKIKNKELDKVWPGTDNDKDYHALLKITKACTARPHKRPAAPGASAPRPKRDVPGVE